MQYVQSIPYHRFFNQRKGVCSSTAASVVSVPQFRLPPAALVLRGSPLQLVAWGAAFTERDFGSVLIWQDPRRPHKPLHRRATSKNASGPQGLDVAQDMSQAYTRSGDGCW